MTGVSHYRAQSVGYRSGGLTLGCQLAPSVTVWSVHWSLNTVLTGTLLEERIKASCTSLQIKNYNHIQLTGTYFFEGVFTIRNR